MAIPKGKLVLTYPGIRVFQQDKQEIVEGETAQTVNSTGKAIVYNLYGPNGLHLTIHDTRWINGQRDVRIAKRNTSPERFDVLVSRLRLGVQLRGKGICSVALRVTDPSESHPTRKQVTLVSLKAMTGIDPVVHLKKLGASAIGTQEDLIDAKRASRNQLMVIFPSTAELIPVAAYILTTVLTFVNTSKID